jgi:hypothetical protein
MCVSTNHLPPWISLQVQAVAAGWSCAGQIDTLHTALLLVCLTLLSSVQLLVWRLIAAQSQEEAGPVLYAPLVRQDQLLPAAAAAAPPPLRAAAAVTGCREPVHLVQ